MSTIVCEDNKILSESCQEHGFLQCGTRTSYTMRTDPRHVLFALARYKFCAKMLSGCDKVLEVGCGDAFGVPILLQEVAFMHCIDIEPDYIAECTQRNEQKERITFECVNPVQTPIAGQYDAVISLDVIEHIAKENEQSFLHNIFAPLKENGIAIVGTPNVFASQYASPLSEMGHVNLKDHKTLKTTLKKYFHNVFMFSMNDEVLHTGYNPMGHYIMALCSGYKGNN